MIIILILNKCVVMYRSIELTQTTGFGDVIEITI